MADYDISTRVSIRWLPDEPSEPTDTLVFNVGSYFVDVRVLKSDGSIDWAMAGDKETLSTSPRMCFYYSYSIVIVLAQVQVS